MKRLLSSLLLGIIFSCSMIIGQVVAYASGPFAVTDIQTKSLNTPLGEKRVVTFTLSKYDEISNVNAVFTNKNAKTMVLFKSINDGVFEGSLMTDQMDEGTWTLTQMKILGTDDMISEDTSFPTFTFEVATKDTEHYSSPGLKTVKGQMTHTDFKSNTNSCASCHMTHTANSKNLLFGLTTEDTCVSCHDGTLGFYDVLTGAVFAPGSDKVTVNADLKTSEDKPITIDKDTLYGANSGRFNHSIQSNLNISMHETNGIVQTSAAPGGNWSNGGTWTSDFTCASCHAPHGSYSDRLLHYNPNGMAEVDVSQHGFGLIGSNAADTTTGFPITNGYLNLDLARDYYLVLDSAENHIKYSTTDKIGVSYFNNIDPITPVVMVYKVIRDNDTLKSIGFEIDTAPWMEMKGAMYDYENNRFIKNTEVITPATGSNITWNYFKAYAYGTDLTGVTAARISRASEVSLDLVKIATYTDKDLPLYVSSNGALVAGNLDPNGTLKKSGVSSSHGLGQALANFCLSCHPDYYSISNANRPAGEKFRHVSAADTLSCSLCHYAHGTDEEIMRNASDQASTEPVQDVNASSSLKRYVNSSVCFGCHVRLGTETLINNKWDYQHQNIGLSSIQYSWSDGNRWGLKK